jgi:hypothetical protein
MQPHWSTARWQRRPRWRRLYISTATNKSGECDPEHNWLIIELDILGTLRPRRRHARALRRDLLEL